MGVAQARSLALLRAAIALVAIVAVLVAAPGAQALPSVGLEPELSAAGLGQGTTLTAKLAFDGTEYDGSPPPLIGLKLTLPAGMAESTSGFASCEKSTLEMFGPVRCPAGSAAGRVTLSSMFVTFGGERVEETAEIIPFFAPGGALLFFLDGHSPVSLEMIFVGTFVDNVLRLEVPLLASVPGAPYASFRLLTLNLGIAHVANGTSIYSLRMPEECAQGNFTWGAEAEFAESGEISRPLSVQATAHTACPERSREESSLPGTEGAIVAPSNKQCVSRRDFIVHIQQIKGVSYRSASVYVNGKPVDVAKGARFRARVDLRGLPKGRYTMRITVTTTSGRQITGTRAYHTCAPKPIAYGKPRL